MQSKRRNVLIGEFTQSSGSPVNIKGKRQGGIRIAALS